MKNILAALVIGLAVAGCTVVNPFQSTTNPVTATNLYEGELAFDASLKTFNTLKGLCNQRVLPPVCRTYVKQGQKIIIQVYAADKAARNFVRDNPTLDATSVVGAFTGLVSSFKDTVTQLSAS